MRIQKNIARTTVAAELNLSDLTVRNIENGTNPPPNESRLKLWLSILGEPDRYGEAVGLLRSFKRSRKVKYQPRHPANEHIDRLLEAYDNGRLDDLDLRLLQMIAPREY